MMVGEPIKYNVQCTQVREATNAEAAIVIVLNGDHGSGFSVQAREELPAERVATILESTARHIRMISGEAGK